MVTLINNSFIYIPPVPEHEVRPLWTVIIPTYNCAQYLEQTLQSVLDQDPGPDLMQIIVVDDHSTKDDPLKVLETLGNGRVSFIRQTQNVGKVRNYESGLMQSKGHLIHLLHGDDKARPGFYKEMERLLKNNPTAKAGFCRSIYVDERNTWMNLTTIEKFEDGIITDCFDRLVIRQCIQTPSMVVRREVYETLGTFHRNFDCMEDWEMWLRIAYHYPVAFTKQVLAEYRIHTESTSHAAFLNGNFEKEHRLITEIIRKNYYCKISNNLLKKRNQEQAEFLFNNYKMISQINSSKFFFTLIKLNQKPKFIYNLFKSIIN